MSTLQYMSDCIVRKAKGKGIPTKGRFISDIQADLKAHAELVTSLNDFYVNEMNL